MVTFVLQDTIVLLGPHLLHSTPVLLVLLTHPAEHQAPPTVCHAPVDMFARNLLSPPLMKDALQVTSAHSTLHTQIQLVKNGVTFAILVTFALVTILNQSFVPMARFQTSLVRLYALPVPLDCIVSVD